MFLYLAFRLDTISQKSVSFLCSFQGACSAAPSPFGRVAATRRASQMAAPLVGRFASSLRTVSGPICCRLSAPSVRPSNGLPPALAVTAGCLRFLANPQNDTEQKVFSQTPRLFASAISIGLTASPSRRLPFFEVFPLQSTWDMMSLSTPSFLPRKEVIQPHLPIRLPCYDFTPVIGLTFGS